MHDTRNRHQLHRAATSLHGQKPRTLDTSLLDGVPSSRLATARRIRSTLPSNGQRSGLRSRQQKAFISRTPRRSYLGSEASLLPSNATSVTAGSRCQLPNDFFKCSGVIASSLARDAVQDRRFARMGSLSTRMMTIGVCAGRKQYGKWAAFFDEGMARAAGLESRLLSFGSDFPRETCEDGFRWFLLDRTKINVRCSLCSEEGRRVHWQLETRISDTVQVQ